MGLRFSCSPGRFQRMIMCPFWATFLFVISRSLCENVNTPFFKNTRIESVEDLQKVYPDNIFFKIIANSTPQELTAVKSVETIPETSRNFVTNSGVCGKALSANQLIVNGQNTRRGDWPWIVAMFIQRSPDDPEYICGGNLITRRHILSAGHCFVLRNSLVHLDSINVYLGMFDIRKKFDPNTQHKKVEQIFVHPEYKYETYSDADIAVLRMKTLAEYTIYVQPVCVWKGSTDLRDIVGLKGTVIGWGRNKLNERPTDEPQLIDLPIVSQEECRRSDTRFQYLTSHRTFCAGLKNDSGPCNGDSGSGLILKISENNETRWYIRGITSVSLLNKNHNILCNLKQYIVFTDIAQYGSWLKTFLTEE